MDWLSVYRTVLEELLTWRSAVDIFLIAALLFFLYMTFLRLGTWKIVLGILVAMTIFVAAEFLDLTGISWIYSNLSHVAVIALIIIFQPELRKMFERAVTLRRKETKESGSELPGMISEALFDLAGQKRGAIIAFPGKEPIQEWLKGGHNLNADPSFPLIASIFDPNSPGHDGALIIMNGKLVRYGARLPISQSSTLPSIYGTRHHAALGLSEVSDALVFVVSEERGTVNFFYQGKAHQINTKEEAFSAITLHWRRTTSYLFDLSMNIKKWYFVPQLMASIGVAAFFWSTLHIAGFEMLEKVLTVPVEYVATPHDTVLVGDKPAEVKLHLVGRKPELDTLTPSQLSVKIDLSKAAPGKHAFPISQENVKLPKKVELLDVVPSNLTLTLAGVMEQDISVKPQLVGKLPQGIRLKSVHVNPEKVRASFPSTAGKEGTLSVMTTPIYLDSIEETTKIFCKIVAPPSFQPVEKRWPDVEVTIEVRSK